MKHRNWYKIFRKFCLKTEFIQCDKKMLNYLKSDKTLKLPEELPGFKKSKPDIFGQIDEDEEWSDWSDDEQDQDVSGNEEILVPEATTSILNIIASMRKKFVPKMNWSCPSDATWQMLDNTGTVCTASHASITMS